MKNLSIILISALAVLFVSCEKVDVDNLDVQDLTAIGSSSISITKVQTEMTNDINEFGFDLYRSLYEEKDMFISPFSISLALSMLTTGASGNTETELLNALGFNGLTTEDLDSYYSKMMANIASADPSTALSIANAIWTNKYIPFKDEFISDCAKYFDSTAESVDFSDASISTRLDKWVSDHTNGKITKMFDDALDPYTACVLANALYFKANWPFDFTRTGKRMVAKVKTCYFSCDDYSGVSLPYGNGAFGMKILLPSKKSSLKELVSNLSGYITTETAIVSLDLPVFSFSYDNNLQDALKSIGIKDAFDNNVADFSKMTEKEICVDQVKHRTYVDVNEKGTEAAAMTAISMKITSAGPAAEPREVDFKVYKDFLFEIFDASTGAVLFIGQHKM